MKKIKHIMVITILVLGAVSMTAQQSLSLSECRSSAIEYNKSLKKANLQKQEAEAQKKSAFTNYLPKLDASGTAMLLPNMDNTDIPGFFLPTAESAEAAAAGNFSGVSDTYFPGMSIETEDLTILMGDVTVQQAIYAGGKIRTANKMAQKGVDIAQQAYQLKEAEVILKTDEAYWGLAAMNEKVTLANKYVEMLSDLEKQMMDAYELGLAPKSERLKVTVQKNDAALNLLKARNGYRIMQMNLCRVIGLPLNTQVALTDSVISGREIRLIDEGVNTALDQRQELKILQGQVELSQLQKKMVTADFKPQLGAQVGYMYTRLNSVYEGGNLSVGASLSIPLFHWGDKMHKKKMAEMKEQQAVVTLEETKELIEMEVQQVIIQLQEAYEAVVWAQDNKSAVEESLDESQISFDVGLNTTTELLNAQASWQTAQAQEISALVNYEVLKTKYRKVIGEL